MLVKAVLLATLVAVVPASSCDNMTVGDAARPDRASQRYVKSLISPVKARFAALAAASRCRQEDNRYSYELLLSKVSGGGRAILERAAVEGVEEGRSITLDGLKQAGSEACGGAIDRLRSADDRLLLLAEQLSQ